MDASNISLSIKQAVPVAQLINELVINAFKYAFTNSNNAKIDIQLSEKGKNGTTSYQPVVKDNGFGVPKNIDYQNTLSFRMQLVNNLTAHLGGDVELRNGRGTCFTIT